MNKQNKLPLKEKIMDTCKWTAEGKIRTRPTLTRKGRRCHATIHLEVTSGEVVMFAHDDDVIKDVMELKPQDAVRLTGTIDARDPRSENKKPYFLNVQLIERLPKDS
jgi:hypothetical protein